MATAKLSGRPMWQQLALPEQVIQERVDSILNQGGYDGARKDRRGTQEWTTLPSDADSAANPDLPELRERSRDLVRNQPLAGGVLNTKVTSAVGAGLRLQPTPNLKLLGWTEEQGLEWAAHVQGEFELFSQTCDVTGYGHFLDLQPLAFRSTLEGGDCFVTSPVIERAGEAYATRLALYEADRVSNPDFMMDTDTISGGVEHDSHGRPEKYHFTSAHPGSLTSGRSITWTPIDAFGKLTGRRNVLHLFQRKRIGQSRGVPDLAAVIEPLKLVSRLTEAELMRSVVSSMFTVFVKSAAGDQGLGPFGTSAPVDQPKKQLKMGSAAVVDLSQGEDVEFANPTAPNTNFDPFVQAILRQVGVEVQIPFELLIKHFTSSYSAARAAMLEAWKYFLTIRVWMTRSLCAPTYELFMVEAVQRGRVIAPGFLTGDQALRQAFLSARWIGDPRGQIDEAKEVGAAKERTEMLLTTMDEESEALTGEPWDRKIPTLRREAELKKELKPAPPPMASPPSPPSEDEEEEEEGEEEETPTNVMEISQ